MRGDEGGRLYNTTPRPPSFSGTALYNSTTLTQENNKGIYIYILCEMDKHMQVPSNTDNTRIAMASVHQYNLRGTNRHNPLLTHIRCAKYCINSTPVQTYSLALYDIYIFTAPYRCRDHLIYLSLIDANHIVASYDSI